MKFNFSGLFKRIEEFAKNVYLEVCDRVDLGNFGFFVCILILVYILEMLIFVFDFSESY